MRTVCVLQFFSGVCSSGVFHIDDLGLVTSEILQFILIVIASSVGEELFYRVAVQVSLEELT